MVFLAVDVCSNPEMNRCNENSVCVNVPGDSYRCDCLPGYVYNPDGFGLICELPPTTTAAPTTATTP